MEELVVLVTLGDLQVGVVVSTREVTEVDKVKFASKLAVKLVAGSFNRGGASLLVDPGDNSVSSASTSVILFLAISIKTKVSCISL